MPSVPMGPLYTEPDLDMELLVFQRNFKPGRATLRTLRSYSANVEAGLDDRIRTETQQRKDADAAEASARQSADNSEAQTRSSADTALAQRIDAEASVRAQADTAEASARQSADTSLGQRITDEATARQNADTQEAQTRAAADAAEASTRAAADSAEVTARQNADAGLQSQITQEVSDRKAADTAEATARANADTGLQSQVTQEVSDRKAAVTAEATARANADTSEASTRAAADTALDARLTTVEGRLPQTAILTYANADLTWTYARPYATGVVPIIEAVVVGKTTDTALFNVQLVGDPTNTAAKFRVNTIPAASVSLLGLTTLTLFQQAPSGVKLHVTARIPQ